MKDKTIAINGIVIMLIFISIFIPILYLDSFNIYSNQHKNLNSFSSMNLITGNVISEAQIGPASVKINTSGDYNFPENILIIAISGFIITMSFLVICFAIRLIK